MRIVLLGPPGAGKGTQAQEIQRRWGAVHISSGDLLRAHLKGKTALGEQARSYIEQGKLVPDELILPMMRERLREPDAAAGYVLDGFPRNLAQARVLEKMLAELGQELEAVIDLEVPEEELVRRNAGRLVCPECEAIYQVDTRPPKEPGKCDRCGSALGQREDDRAEVTRHRFQVYRRETEPLVAYYLERGLLHKLDGTIGVDRVCERMAEIVGCDGSRLGERAGRS